MLIADAKTLDAIQDPFAKRDFCLRRGKECWDSYELLKREKQGFLAHQSFRHACEFRLLALEVW